MLRVVLCERELGVTRDVTVLCESALCVDISTYAEASLVYITAHVMYSKLDLKSTFSKFGSRGPEGFLFGLSYGKTYRKSAESSQKTSLDFRDTVG
jgi:hypothetical protein